MSTGESMSTERENVNQQSTSTEPTETEEPESTEVSFCFFLSCSI